MRSHLRLAVALAAAVATSATAYAFSSPARGDDKVVCKDAKEPISRFPRRLCYTRAEWDMIAEQHKRAFGEIVNRPAVETRK